MDYNVAENLLRMVDKRRKDNMARKGDKVFAIV